MIISCALSTRITTRYSPKPGEIISKGIPYDARTWLSAEDAYRKYFGVFKNDEQRALFR